MSKKIKIIDNKEFELTKQERLTSEDGSIKYHLFYTAVKGHPIVIEYLCSLPAIKESEVPDFNSLDEQCFKRFSN